MMMVGHSKSIVLSLSLILSLSVTCTMRRQKEREQENIDAWQQHTTCVYLPYASWRRIWFRLAYDDSVAFFFFFFFFFLFDPLLSFYDSSFETIFLSLPLLQIEPFFSFSSFLSSLFFP